MLQGVLKILVYDLPINDCVKMVELIDNSIPQCYIVIGLIT